MGARSMPVEVVFLVEEVLVCESKTPFYTFIGYTN
jgi:hypothetical protein